MSKAITMPKKTESCVVDFLHQNHEKRKTPQEIRNWQIKFLNKEWTLTDWKILQSEFKEKDIIIHFFDRDAAAYAMYKRDADDKLKMLENVKKGLDPHHITTEDLDAFYLDVDEQKKSTVSDHYPSNEKSQLKNGDRNLDYKIDLLLMNQFQGYEFTTEGLQTFAFMHGHFIPLKSCEPHVKKVNTILRKIRFMNARQTGIVDMENEAVHEIKKFCKKNKMPDEVTNALIMRGKKIVSLMNTNIGRNIGQSVVAENREGLLKKLVHGFRNASDFLGFEANEVISQLIKESEEDEGVKQ